MQNFSFGAQIEPGKVIVTCVSLVGEVSTSERLFRGKAPTRQQLINEAKFMYRAPFWGGPMPKGLDVTLMLSSKDSPSTDIYRVTLGGEPEPVYVTVWAQDISIPFV